MILDGKLIFQQQQQQQQRRQQQQRQLLKFGRKSGLKGSV